MTRALVLLNPAAGRGRVGTLWPEIERALRAAGVDFDVARTGSAAEAMDLAARAGDHHDAVIAIGGDGTLNTIANGLLRGSNEGETLPLGVVPLGSGDDFAKVLPPEAAVGGKAYDWHAAVQKIAGGRTQLYDAGRLVADGPRQAPGEGPHYFVNTLDVGFGETVARKVAEVPKFLTGQAMYLTAILKTLADYHSPWIAMKMDDLPLVEGTTTMTVIGNGRSFGGGFWWAPEARPDDGLFDVLALPALGRLACLGFVPKMAQASHIKDPRARFYRARRVVVDSPKPLGIAVDGDLPFTAARHFEVDVLEKKLKILV
jgi:YegS/Rv2252/BmrU family lipid kinase